MRTKSNTYSIIGRRAVIDVSTPKFPDTFTLIDAVDLPRVVDGRGRWFAMSCGSGTLYVRRGIQPRGRQIALHVYLLGAAKGAIVDHANGDGLDNRRRNIRVTCPTGNMRNRRLNENNRSGTPGVCWAKDTRKWQAQIKDNGRAIYLGQFDQLRDAVIARQAAEKVLAFHPNHGRAI